MERPVEIVWFERIIFGTLALGIIQSWISWDAATELASPTFILTTQAFVFLVVASLTLLISRRRSNVSKWIAVGFFVIGVPMVVKLALDGLLIGSRWISVGQSIGQFVAYGLLFTPSSRRWFGHRRASRPPGIGASG